ncbi:MAG: carbonic anhydrase [Candidatus Krumholzibacteria bacterium]|jgi:carbonic anhydrase|nr:carbonic anhydrase [Candidatus Krumholzibacteria bacterium]MDP6668618.1 carbonic anhydrase [Candidatus Krumholzibacteria bacterium]MDP6797656.1 carbonic anhydrase [Candidatus Krumholzibacteria bacterium]MDP7022308.1 carbonic anhydrase [Candidatus Krumholzibacteria bacterium]
MNPEETLAFILDGNARFARGESKHPPSRQALELDQKPLAVVLGCSDSRVPPERVFDCAPGDLFVVRVAGNILDDVVLGSIEYAAGYLGVSLILVLGHSSCGAVAAARTGHGEGNLSFIVGEIEPALDELREEEHAAEKANARRSARGLPSQSPQIEQAISSGKLKVQAALFDLETARVELLEP